MGAPASDSGSPSDALVVRNTFLTVDLPRPDAPRRTASVPASARLGCGRQGGGARRQGARSCDDRGLDASSGSEASTEAGSLAADEASAEGFLEADASESERPAAAAGQGSLEAEAAENENRHAAAGKVTLPPEAVALLNAKRVLTLDQAIAQPSLMLSMLQLPRQQPTRLNSQAKAWTPSSYSALASMPMDMEHTSQVRAVVRAASTAAAGVDGVLSMDAFEAAHGWNIVANIRACDLPQKEWLLGVVKEALLEGARQSSSIYVLGYRWRPFVPTPTGFTACVAAVPDEEKVCWSLLSHGSCRGGAQCRWEHPAQQTLINVAVEVKGP